MVHETLDELKHKKEYIEFMKKDLSRDMRKQYRLIQELREKYYNILKDKKKKEECFRIYNDIKLLQKDYRYKKSIIERQNKDLYEINLVLLKI